MADCMPPGVPYDMAQERIHHSSAFVVGPEQHGYQLLGITEGVVIEEDAVLGVGVIVLPNVIIGRGAIVTAGSVVTKSFLLNHAGNPAQAIATVEIPFGRGVSLKEFAKGLRPIR